METERLREEDGHLASRQRSIRTIVAASASDRDPGIGERLDEPEEWVAQRDVIERGNRWSEGNVSPPPDLDISEPLNGRSAALLNVKYLSLWNGGAEPCADQLAVVGAPAMDRALTCRYRATSPNSLRS